VRVDFTSPAWPLHHVAAGGTLAAMWPTEAQRTVQKRMRSLCTECRGEGAIAHPRATVMSNYGAVDGDEGLRCEICEGRGWLYGMVLPL
jgi:hypothetical protein